MAFNYGTYFIADANCAGHYATAGTLFANAPALGQYDLKRSSAGISGNFAAACTAKWLAALRNR